jgi:hypothetical protein
VTTAPPTPDQLRNILDYVGGGVKPSDLVQGAKDAKEALELFKKDEGKFVRPVVCSFPFPFFLFLFILRVCGGWLTLDYAT